MGCASIREPGIEERCIIQAENGLGFNKINVNEIDTIFRKYSSNGVITQSQLIHISNTLNFKILNTGNHSQIQSFFMNLRSEDGTYELKDLLLIGIMLGRGKSSTKAMLIYEAFDTSLTHQLDIQDVQKEILTRMIYHSSHTLPELVSSEIAFPDAEVKILKYKKKLFEMVEPAITQISSKLLIRGKVISQDTFVETFSGFYYGELVNSSGLRRYLLDLRVNRIN